MARDGICISCHQEIPTGSLAVSLLHHAADVVGAIPVTDEQRTDLVHKIMLMSALVQVGGGSMFGLVCAGFGLWFLARRRQRRKPS